MYIVTHGKPEATIVLPLSPAPVEIHAASELRKYISLISGTELPVANAPVPGTSSIFIGSAVPPTFFDTPSEAMGYDGYIIKTVGDDLALAGAKPYSCLYAVYHLLEQYLGCGFFEDGDQVPRRESVEIGEIDAVERPRFEWRILALFHTPAYSGMRWNSWEQWKQYFDWAAKKRYNICDPGWLTQYTGIAALAAAKLGVPIELTDWQKQHLALMRRVFDYARMCGIRIVTELSFHVPWLDGQPGSMPYVDGIQTVEFVKRYAQLTGQEIPLIPYKWCSTGKASFQWLDPRHPETHRFLRACMQAYGDALGTDHFWNVNSTAEGALVGDDPEENNRITYALVADVVKTVREADPEALVYTRPPFPYAKTYQAQRQSIRDAGLPVVADFWLHMTDRTPDFKNNDYYWGLPWATGMIVGCGKHTNPWEDMDAAIGNAKALVADPRAGNCIGFLVAGEYNHRNYLMSELFADLAWNPLQVEKDDYLQRWSAQRYGDAADELSSVSRLVADTLLSHYNMDMSNRPLYRDWTGGYLPGLTATSVRRTLSYLPRLREAMEILLDAGSGIEDSPLYRFDLIDYGRTYLGAIFNFFLAEARIALRAQDRQAFETAAVEVESVMHAIARLCSAHELFRLKTHDDRAKGWPQILPGYDNSWCNWITWTWTSTSTKSVLLDYTAEDFCELVEYYFLPRVQLYLAEMRKLLDEGKDISGDLGGRLLYLSDWATPKATLPWSPYGAPVEPELKAGDISLANRIVEGGSVSGRFDCYDGPIRPLMRELLDRFPVPANLAARLLTPDPTETAVQAESLGGVVGDVLDGLCVPGVIELVRVPPELDFVVSVTKVSEIYNLARGGVTAYSVELSHWMKLTRLADEKSERGDHSVFVFGFDYDNHRWIVRYDPGTQDMFTSLCIDRAD